MGNKAVRRWAKCGDCGEEHLVLYRGYCKRCYSKKYRRKEPAEKAFERTIKNYGLTLKEYKARLPAGCEICKKTDVKLVVDHNHTTGRFRGILCHKCNLGLGHFLDNTEYLAGAIDYINKDLNGKKIIIQKD